MPFMKIETTDATFYVGESIHNRENIVCPAFVDGAVERFCAVNECDPATVRTIVGQWWARYSAPGYMDCTDWVGPYATEADAIKACRDAYGDDEKEGGS